ncbi:MAG: nuclear transport factor 2 family protein, partial [Planctomycetota bacterium]
MILKLNSIILVATSVMLGSPVDTLAQDEARKMGVKPTSSRDQQPNQRNTIPEEFQTIIIAPDAKSRERALMLIRLYDVFATDPRPERLAEFLSPDYVQHSSMAPDGPDGIGMVFSTSVKQYPVKLDVHKVMVVGDWAMAHVNFRNLEKSDEGDLGSTAVDMFTFGPDGKLSEHWDAVQGIPTYAVPPKQGMFRRVQDHAVWPYETVAPIIPAERDIPQKRWWEPNKGVAESAGKLETPTIQSGEVPAVYYDRQKIDVSNLRDFYDGLLIADAMIHADAMFDAETKWKLTLFQMIRSGSRHHQARCAFQLAYMGVPMMEILKVWEPDYVDKIRDKRAQAAFKYLQVACTHPADVTADTHAMLRTQYIDRQIAELFELTAINAALATHDLITPIPTDQTTIDWASANLAGVGWEPGNNRSAPEEQRANLFAGEVLEKAYGELLATWKPEDLTAVDPQFETDWVNYLTGYDISMVTFDSYRFGFEYPFY